MDKSKDIVKYECKFCSFIADDKIAAYMHVRKHYKGLTKLELILFSELYIKEIVQPSSYKKIHTQPTMPVASLKTSLLNNTKDDQLSAESISEVADFLPTPTPAPLLPDTSDISSFVKTQSDTTTQSTMVVSKQDTSYISLCVGYKSKCTYKCICSPRCNFMAKKLKKLIGHVLTVHHPNQTEEWVISNFPSLFMEYDPVPPPPKKKKKAAGPSYINTPSYQRPSYTRGELGFIEIYPINRNFDYDLDGRVK